MTGPPSDRTRVLVEVRIASVEQLSASDVQVRLFPNGPLVVDAHYDPVPMRRVELSLQADLDRTGERVVVVAGWIEPTRVAALRRLPHVVAVWSDPSIAPLGPPPYEGPWDCTRQWSGDVEGVRRLLEVDQLSGLDGAGVGVGIVDVGITAENRDPFHSDDLASNSWPVTLVPHVVGGCPADWGKTGWRFNWHGNMCATDVLSTAPGASLYDLRAVTADLPATVGTALKAFDWAIEQRQAGRPGPSILSNSWAVPYSPATADYATDPEHPFTRTVLAAIDCGLLVLFGAGNCGRKYPITDCGNGPRYHEIWGANGHPQVMCVGAVNVRGELACYSSGGPAALSADKPDFCAATQFSGYHQVDIGTSAATAVAAGVVALLKQAHPALDQATARQVLRATAAPLPPHDGWNIYAGAGIISAKRARHLLP